MFDHCAGRWALGEDLLTEGIETQAGFIHQFEETLFDAVEVHFPAMLVSDGSEKKRLLHDDVHLIVRGPTACRAASRRSVISVQERFRPSLKHQSKGVFLVVDVNGVSRGEMFVLREERGREGVDRVGSIFSGGEIRIDARGETERREGQVTLQWRRARNQSRQRLGREVSYLVGCLRR